MFEITSQFVDKAYLWSGWLVIVGTILTLIGGLGQLFSGRLRDTFAEQRLSANEVKTAAANAEAAKAMLEQERLKTQLAWRRLTQIQADALVSILKGQHIKIWLTFVGDDPECNVYRQDLDVALRAAGLETSYFNGYQMAVGLKIMGPDGANKQILLRAFKHAGIDLIDAPGDSRRLFKDELEILVGTKPPPEFRQHGTDN